MPFDEALDALYENDPEGFTIREMSEAVNRTPKWCRNKVRALIKAGKAEYNGTRRATRMDGRGAAIPVYRLIRRKVTP